MQQGCKRSKWVSTCLLKSFLAAIILPHVRHLNFTTPSSSCLAIIESRLALKSEKGDYVKKKEDTKIFCSFYFVGYTISITYLSCLCHLDTWLVREFFVLKSFPQWSQVWGFVGRCVSMWASKLSFLFPTLPQTLHLKNFWPSSKSSNIRFSGSGNPGMWLNLAKWKQRSLNNLDIDFPSPCDRVVYGFWGIPCFLMASHTPGSSVLHWGESECELWSSSYALHSFHKRRMTTGSFLLHPGSSSYFAKLGHQHLEGE